MASRTGRALLVQFVRKYSSAAKDVKHYKMVIAGGGTGGCSVAARACRALGKGNVAVIEPAEYHYYQPMWTLVGAGIKRVDQSAMLMSQVLPKHCDHHKERVEAFDPDNNTVTLSNGQKLSYDYLVVGLGIQINPHKIEGFVEALKSDPNVCCNYLRYAVEKTYPALQNFRGGQAIFTFPSTPIKCAGAPQKIMYLADEYWRKHGVRDKTTIRYNTSLPVIFGVKKYAASLTKVVAKKDIKVTHLRNLIAIDTAKKTATFEILQSDPKETETYNYDFLHVAPPMSAPDVLKNTAAEGFTDAAGWLDVVRETTQHKKYPNVFGIGDCTNIPTAKTAAAVASQNKILFDSISQVMAGKTPTTKYDGYTSCPLITGYHSCILAEFDFDAQPLETFPIDQGIERRSMFHMKKDIMPEIYWKMLLTGHWGGPGTYRKMMHLGMSR